jgi:hypothetical protein
VVSEGQATVMEILPRVPPAKSANASGKAMLRATWQQRERRTKNKK